MEKQENKKQPEDRNEAGSEPVRDEELENVSGGVHHWHHGHHGSGPNGFPDERRPWWLFGRS